jgi:CheY-like chemotaxis protein
MSQLNGLKALVVEDEAGVALLIEDMLTELGCEITAMAALLPRACQLAQSAVVDFAVLDVNLNGLPVFPVADILRERGIPFVFSTGYGANGLPNQYKNQPLVTKPFALENLERQLLIALRCRTVP